MAVVDAKQAIDLAHQHLKDLFPDAEAVRLEELETANPGSLWRVTLSYLMKGDEPLSGTSRMAAILAPENMRREFKVFEIHPQDGALLAMRIRKV